MLPSTEVLQIRLSYTEDELFLKFPRQDQTDRYLQLDRKCSCRPGGTSSLAEGVMRIPIGFEFMETTGELNEIRFGFASTIAAEMWNQDLVLGRCQGTDVYLRLYWSREALDKVLGMDALKSSGVTDDVAGYGSNFIFNRYGNTIGATYSGGGAAAVYAAAMSVSTKPGESDLTDE